MFVGKIVAVESEHSSLENFLELKAVQEEKQNLHA
jgi:hypothetical protein